MKHPLPTRLLLVLSILAPLTGCATGREPKPAPPPPAATATGTPWWKRSDRTLAALVERALSGNRDLRAADARLREAKALRQESRSAFLPVATVSSGYRRQLDSTVFFKGVPEDIRNQDIFDVGIDSAWELDLFGRIRRTVEANDALAAATEADLSQMRLLIVTETARAYVELAGATASIPLQERQLEIAGETLRLLHCQIDAGKISRDRLGPAEAGAANARSTLRDLRLAERSARNRLGVLLGGDTLRKIDAKPPEIPAPKFGGDATRLLARRPDILAAERRLAASTAAIGIVRADYFPTLSFVARAGFEANNLGGLDATKAGFFAFGPRLQWDLLNLHRTRAREKAAEARREQAFASWENSVLLALEEIDNALAGYDEAGQEALDRRRAATALEESAHIAKQNEEQGLADPLTARAAEQAALQAKLARIRADAGLANATLFLHQSLAVDR